jgi:hypothetical protein
MMALTNPVSKIELKAIFHSNLSSKRLFLTKKAIDSAKEATKRSNTKINHLGTILNLFKA